MRDCSLARSLLLGLSLFGCAQTQQTERRDSLIPQGTLPPPKMNTQNQQGNIVSVERDLPEMQTVLWVAYGMGIANASHKNIDSGAPADRFAEHVAGLQTMVQVWKELQQKLPAAIRDKPESQLDPQLEKLVQVFDAGFVEEYALNYLSLPGWRVSSAKLATLKLAAFADWQKQNLARHSFTPHAQVTFANSPPIIGESIRTQMPRFAPEQCRDALEKLKLVIVDWEAQGATQRDRMLSSASREQFVRTLVTLQQQGGAARDIVWIAPEVADLYSAAAFCAIEVRREPLAESYLHQALRVNPAHAMGYAELAHVLVTQKRFEEALAQIDEAQRWTSDPCTRAVLLRKRGYIYVEQGQFPAARLAYQTSLKLDPGNALAISELHLIEVGMRRRGQVIEEALRGDSTAPQDAAPEMPSVILTSCPRN